MDKNIIDLDGSESIFNRHKGCTDKKHVCNFGTTIKLFIAQDSANKLDSREQNITGATMSDTMTEVLKKSQWKRLRKRLGKKLSLEGEASVQVDIIDGNPFVSLGKLISYRKVAGELQEVILDAEDIVEIDGYDVAFPVYEKFTLIGGRVYKLFGVETKDGWLDIKEAVIYPPHITRLPVKIFQNNEEGVSDIANTGMWQCITMLNEFAAKLPSTFDKTQFGLLVNRNMTGGKTGTEILKELADKGVIEVNGMDSQLGGGIQPIGAPGYMLELMGIIDYLEDKVLKFTFTTRDSTATGTNKHGTEIGLFNQFATEYLLNKKEIREEDYTDFYKILAMFTLDDFSNVEVTLGISELTENLLKAMNPETAQVQTNINEDKTKEEGE